MIRFATALLFAGALYHSMFAWPAPRVASVSGRVLVDGKPLAGAVVLLRSPEGIGLSFEPTDGEGRFAVAKAETWVTPGKYQVIILDRACRVPPTYGTSCQSPLTVELCPGDTELANLDLSVRNDQ